MKMTKRLFALLMSAAMLVSTSACSLGHEHEYDNACDTDCNTCGEVREVGDHVFSEYTPSLNNHTCVCDECGAEFTLKHNFAEGATSCSDCGFDPWNIEIISQESFPHGYITTEETVIDTEYITYTIPEGIYVVENLELMSNIMCDTIEQVTGLKFMTEEMPQKINAIVTRPEAGDEDEYAKNAELLYGQSFSIEDGVKTINIFSGDLFLGNSCDIIDLLGYMIEAVNNISVQVPMLESGFYGYNTYKVLQQFEKTNSTIASSFVASGELLAATAFSNEDCLYEHPVEYWIENNFPSENAFNGDYALGFRFMNYLDDKYGSYTEWITSGDEADRNAEERDVQASINILKAAYDDDVLDGFYDWHKENADLFVNNFFSLSMRVDNAPYDTAKYITIYPGFFISGIYCNLTEYYMGMDYNDLYVNIEEARTYFCDYKGMDVSKLKLKLDHAAEVELYAEDGTLIKTASSGNIDLDGVSYIKLVGSGSFSNFEIVGF